MKLAHDGRPSTRTPVALYLIHILLVLPFTGQLTAGDQDPEYTSRAPVDDATFAQIVDLFQYDPDLPLKAVTLGSWPYRIPYVIEKVAYRSTHNETVPAYFAHPVLEQGRRYPAVILIHGSNGIWGKNEDWVLD